MKEQIKCGVPHDPKELYKCIYTFLHLEESERYQLLFNRVDNNGKCDYQLYGRFEGERIITSDGTSKFLMTQVDLKLVNMIIGASVKYEVEDFEIRLKNTELLFTVIIKPTTGAPPKKPKPFEELYLFEYNQSITFNVSTRQVGSDRNGRPCRSFTSF